MPWASVTEDAFIQSKRFLADATLLRPQMSNAKLALYTDASYTPIGTVIEQLQHGKWFSFFREN